MTTLPQLLRRRRVAQSSLQVSLPDISLRLGIDFAGIDFALNKEFDDSAVPRSDRIFDWLDLRAMTLRIHTRRAEWHHIGAASGHGFRTADGSSVVLRSLPGKQQFSLVAFGIDRVVQTWSAENGAGWM